ncbi:glycosyltransferase family 61 protein [Pseudophaeobacter sp.]|uniref:glycosyltransferase family 61 protein n=1 Tax=Pseudophaeobacter sp. TaxID=1971739 RepID=UPI003298AD0C
MLVLLRRLLTRLGVLKQQPLDGVHLSLVNDHGSVQHFYHFMMGFMVPLVHIWPDVVAKSAGRPVFVRSCAVMDPILKALQLEGLQILPAPIHRSLGEKTDWRRKLGHRLDHVSTPGFDTPAKYDPAVFQAVRERLFDQLGPEIAAERDLLAPLFQGAGPKILIIDRLPPAAFYSSEASEVKGAGSERRSVENMGELADFARSRFDAVASVTLEGRSLAAQMALFSMADVIVAQHGAALANLLWAQKGAYTVEILAKEHETANLMPHYFSKLAAAMGLQHDFLQQTTDHGPVKVQDFAALMDALAPSGSSSISVSKG